jgi:hypothetical protein
MINSYILDLEATIMFFLKYPKYLCIIIIKVEEFNHTNDVLLASTLGGL